MRRQRRAFTITELMVVLALVIFIMYILATAFSAGATAFRNLKAIGDMNEKLRATGQLLRRNLERDHFEEKKRVSDPDFWKDGPPRQGFLRIYNGDTGTSEGTDDDLNVSARASTHGLHFTVKARGNTRGDFFRAGVPAGSPLTLLPLQDTRFQETTNPTSVSSSWAEVAVFLRPSYADAANTVPLTTDDPDNPNATPQPLYALYIRQRVLVPDNDLVTQYATAKNGSRIASTQSGAYAEVSCMPDPTPTPNAGQFLYFNNPADLTMPARRLGQKDTPGSSPVSATPTQGEEDPTQGGNDVVLTNVLSFEVKVMIDPVALAVSTSAAKKYDFVPLTHATVQAYSMSNPTFPKNGTTAAFDTWSQAKDDAFDYSAWATAGTPTSVPLYQSGTRKIRLLALQITIRIWDVNTKQTRQSSVVVEL